MSVHVIQQLLEQKVRIDEYEDGGEGSKGGFYFVIQPSHVLIICQKTENCEQKNGLELHEAVEKQVFPDVRIENAPAFLERHQIFPHLDEQRMEISEDEGKHGDQNNDGKQENVIIELAFSHSDPRISIKVICFHQLCL
jgi:hypothetical protein